MELGVGLPNMVPHLDRDLVLEWSKQADTSGFSSLSTGERLSYDNNDVFVELSMAAAVTERIRIMTSVLVLPLHTTAVVAKQAASLDYLTDGRFVLAVGSGGHVADYDATPVPFANRFSHFEKQIIALRALWSGQPMGECGAPLGPLPAPGRPTLLIGPSTPQAGKRAHLTDGVLTFMFDSDPGPQRAIFDAAEESWRAHGREGRPRFIAGLFYALGPDGEEKAQAVLNRYYASFGPEQQQAVVSSITTLNEKNVREAIDRFEAAGADELVLCPLVPEIDQLHRLRDLRG
jgi:alkanesulfonate monooxygenase SsuD/methylene tetrahydromethanopterin reductase-like flavin-dependent oxidoreductase (luciferase family)